MIAWKNNLALYCEVKHMHLLPHGSSTFLYYVMLFFVTLRHNWEKRLQGTGFVFLWFWFLVPVLAHRFRGHSAVLGSADCGSRGIDRHRSDGAHGRSYSPEERQQAETGWAGAVSGQDLALQRHTPDQFLQKGTTFYPFQNIPKQSKELETKLETCWTRE